MHSTLVSRKCEIYVITEDKKYIIPVIYKSKLTKSSNISQPTLIISKCNQIISSKFKAIKFILE